MSRKKILETLRAGSSKVQKRQQNEKMNTNVGKKGSTKSMGTKSSFPRSVLLERRKDKPFNEPYTPMTTEKKKAVADKNKIEKSKKKLNALRAEKDKLVKLAGKRTAAQDRRLKALRKQIDAIESARVTSTSAKRSGTKKVSLPTFDGGKVSIDTRRIPKRLSAGGTVKKGTK